ncbi:MAG: hypothetical protein HYV76_01895 [Candidatus Vogelbacteria bacterium]|nr:hypothetical protein [Candidatus Vogelbacteria bacterium]
MKLNLNPNWLKPDIDRLHLRRQPSRFWLVFCLLMIALVVLLIMAHTILFILWSEPIAEEAITQDVTDRHQVNVSLLSQISARERAFTAVTSTTLLGTDPGVPPAFRSKMAP